MKKQWRRRQETGKMQKTAFGVAKGHLSDAKRLSFTMQKTTFCNALNINMLQAWHKTACPNGTGRQIVWGIMQYGGIIPHTRKATFCAAKGGFVKCC